MEKKKINKKGLTTKIIVLTVVLSILITVVVVPSSAMGLQQEPDFVDEGILNWHSVGMVADLSVKGGNPSYMSMAYNIPQFLGFTYNPLSNIPINARGEANGYWETGNYPDYSKKVSVNKLVAATSTITGNEWYLGKIDARFNTSMFSSQFMSAYQGYLANDYDLSVFRESYADTIDKSGTFNNSTINGFSEWRLDFKGCIDSYNIKNNWNKLMPSRCDITYFIENSFVSIDSNGNATLLQSPSQCKIKVRFGGLGQADYNGSEFNTGLHLYSAEYWVNDLEDIVESVYYSYSPIIGTELSIYNDSSLGRDYGVSLLTLKCDIGKLVNKLLESIHTQTGNTGFEFMFYNPSLAIEIVPMSSNSIDSITFSELSYVPLYAVDFYYDDAEGDAVTSSYNSFSSAVNDTLEPDTVTQFGRIFKVIAQGVGAFFDMPIFGDFTMAHVLYIALGCGFVLLVLKFFAGG